MGLTNNGVGVAGIAHLGREQSVGGVADATRLYAYGHHTNGTAGLFGYVSTE